MGGATPSPDASLDTPSARRSSPSGPTGTRPAREGRRSPGCSAHPRGPPPSRPRHLGHRPPGRSPTRQDAREPRPASGSASRSGRSPDARRPSQQARTDAGKAACDPGVFSQVKSKVRSVDFPHFARGMPAPLVSVTREHERLVHAVARPVGLDQPAVVDDPVDHRRGEPVVAEDRTPPPTSRARCWS